MTSEQPDRPARGDRPAMLGQRLHLHGWTHPTVLAVAGLSAASGFAQFSGTAALADVARAFGETTEGMSIAEQAGLSGTVLGIGLAIIRLASLGSLPLAGLADELGRRRVLLVCVALGLALTVVAAASPTYWWFVALFALARPALSATNALCGVIAAEETSSIHRAKAMSLIAAGYAVGAGIPALLRGIAGDLIGFRGLFLAALLPLALIPFAARAIEEPERFELTHAAAVRGAVRRRLPVLGVFDTGLRARLGLLAVLTFALAFLTAPQNTYLFVYAENVLGMPRSATATGVLLAAPIGLVGLLIGRWASDRVGRRWTAGLSQILVGMGAIITYNSEGYGAIAGYLFAIFFSAIYTPAMASLSAELFPTSLRATAAGWLTAGAVAGAVTGLITFGLTADLFDSFGPAALIIAVPVSVSAILFLRLPETRGLELEESAPETT